jgi:hypothetical protein
MVRTSPADVARSLRQRFARWQGLDAVDPGDPLDLSSLLKMLDLSLEESPQLSNLYGGRVIGELDRRRSVVRVSEDFGRRARRFTIAHEIAHHQLHDRLLHHRDAPTSVLGMDFERSPLETEANDYAAELLMPEQGFTTAYYARFGEPLVLRQLTDTQIYRLGRLANGRELSPEEFEKRGLPYFAEVAAACAFDATSGYPSLRDAFDVTTSAAAIRLRSLGLVRLGPPAARNKSPRARHDRDDSPSLRSIATSPSASSIPLDRGAAAPPRVQTHVKAVALLGEYAQHWKNRRLLKQRGWAVLDDDSADAPEKLRQNPPCGVVVHRSFWKGLSPARCNECLRMLAELSSFIVVRIEGGTLPRLDATVATLSANGIGSFQLSSDSDLNDADFVALERILKVRQTTKDVVLQADAPLDETTTNLLALVAAERLSTEGSPVVVNVKRLAAGHSGARNFVLSHDDFDQPTFAKTNDVRSLFAELQRTRDCQPYVPSLVVPELRFHSSLGALLQPFVSAVERAIVAAPSLREFLGNLTESPTHARLVVESIVPTVLGVFTRLGSARVNDVARHLGYVLGAYEADRNRGLDWVNSPLSSEIIDNLARRALETLRAYSQVAMVHGDAHPGNILLKNSTDPVIVDFAHAGPGHPLFDLARFELGLWTVLLKKGDRRAAERLVRTLLADDTIHVERMGRLQGAGFTADIALRTSILVRESCHTVLRGDPQWFQQYRSMHVLLALLALQSPVDHYLSFAVFSAVAQTVRPLLLTE